MGKLDPSGRLPLVFATATLPRMRTEKIVSLPPERDSLLRRVGNTPLIPLLRLPTAHGVAANVKIFAKVEWFNPGGSVKDRPALRMVRAAEARGEMHLGKILTDATSGNTGIAYAMICARRGYRCEIFLPANASEERKRILRAYGVKLNLTDPAQASDGAIIEVRKRVGAEPEKYFYPDQYSNPNNPLAHYETTAPEIWRQSRGKITHFVGGLGTSGTLMGAGRRLKKFNKHIQIVALQPDAAFHGLEGLKRMDSAIVPAIYDKTFPDRHLDAPTEPAQEMVRELARREGLLVGVSSGAALWGALSVAKELAAEKKSALIVVLFPDGGDKYLSEGFWAE